MGGGHHGGCRRAASRACGMQQGSPSGVRHAALRASRRAGAAAHAHACAVLRCALPGRRSNMHAPRAAPTCSGLWSPSKSSGSKSTLPQSTTHSVSAPVRVRCMLCGARGQVWRGGRPSGGRQRGGCRRRHGCGSRAIGGGCTRRPCTHTTRPLSPGHRAAPTLAGGERRLGRLAAHGQRGGGGQQLQGRLQPVGAAPRLAHAPVQHGCDTVGWGGEGG